MEVPPGRVERISDGGSEAIRAILAELRAMKFNGLLKTSVFRGDTPSQGVLVLCEGDGVLAEHRSSVDLVGREALPEILRDAASERAQLEVRTYDYGHSTISIDHLQRSYPEAAVQGIGDADQLLSEVTAEAAKERETYLRDLEARRDQERRLIDREEELYRRKWELEQEYQRSSTRQRELESLRSELQAVKEASGMIMSRLEERRTSEDVEVESQKKLLAIEAEKGRAQAEAQRRALAERQAQLEAREREATARESAFRERETALGLRETSEDRERKQVNELYASLQAEMEKIAEARKAFDDRLAEAERRERELLLREQGQREWEEKLRDHDASITGREAQVADRERSLGERLKALEGREAEIEAKAKDLGKREEALEAEDASLDGRRDELARATKRMQKAAKDLTARDAKVASEEREARERQVDVRRRQRELAAQAKELEQRVREVGHVEAELSSARNRLKEQALKLIRSERDGQERLRALENLERDLGKRDAALNRREAALDKREKATEAHEGRLAERSDALDVSEEYLRAQ